MKTCTNDGCNNPVFSKGKCKYHTPKTPIKTRAKTKPKTVSVAKMKGKTQDIVNAYIRQRDSQDGYFDCISCGCTHPISNMDAGHYVPVRGGSFLRYHEWNINGECKGCNGFDEFHLIGYRKRLIEKIGEDAVRWLEDNRRTVKKWSREELNEIIEKYSV